MPDDADVVLVLGPSDPFGTEEISALQRYADRGGHLFIALDPDANSVQISAPPSALTGGERSAAPAASDASSTSPAPAASARPLPTPSARPVAAPAASTGSAKPKASVVAVEPAEPAPPGMAALAQLAQLSYSPTLLANEHNHVRLSFNDADHTRLITNSFSSHASVSTLSRNAPAAAGRFFWCRQSGSGPGATAKSTLRCAPDWHLCDRNKNFVQDKDTEKANPYNIAAAVSRPIVPGAVPVPPAPDPKKPPEKKPETREMRAFVVADGDAFSDLVLSNVRGNQFFLVDAVRWLVGEESFAGAETSEEDAHIEQTKQQDLSWYYATIFGAPCLVMAVGVVVSRRSRRTGGARR